MTFAAADHMVISDGPALSPRSYTAGSFRMTVSPSAKLLKIAMSGFWSEDTAKAFVVALKEQVESLGIPQGQYLVMCDMTGLPIQSQAIFGYFCAMMDTGITPLRLAVVAGNTASRMQARRLLAGRAGTSLFANEALALRWLARGDEA